MVRTNALRLALRDQGTIVTALHVGYMDTDMTARVDAPKAGPRGTARQTAELTARCRFDRKRGLGQPGPR
jgi:NAD(P)-dependent dehydrogenase (short-subunit alcohol dehydrogenase family)